MGEQSQNQASHISPDNMRTLQKLLTKFSRGDALTEQEYKVIKKIEAILRE